MSSLTPSTQSRQLPIITCNSRSSLSPSSLDDERDGVFRSLLAEVKKNRTRSSKLKGWDDQRDGAFFSSLYSVEHIFLASLFLIRLHAGFNFAPLVLFELLLCFLDALLSYSIVNECVRELHSCLSSVSHLEAVKKRKELV